MWLWALAASLFLLAALFFFFLYRRARLALDLHNNLGDQLTTDSVVALLAEFESLGDAIIDRVELKQRELEQTIRLLDAKFEAVQVTLAATRASQIAPGVKEANRPEPVPSLKSAKGGPALKYEEIFLLFEQGWEPLAIAEEKELKVDKVRLLHNLYKSSK